MTAPGSNAEHFGQWLTTELEQRGKTGHWLAAELGIHRPTVYRWLHGQYRPEAATCQAIADALGIEHDLVLAAAGYRTYRLSVDGDVRRQITDLIDEIPEDLLLPLIPMLRGLADVTAQAELREALRAVPPGDRHE